MQGVTNEIEVHVANNNTVEPLNKGYCGDNINSAVLSFIYRERGCPLLGGSQCI